MAYILRCEDRVPVIHFCTAHNTKPTSHSLPLKNENVEVLVTSPLLEISQLTITFDPTRDPKGQYVAGEGQPQVGRCAYIFRPKKIVSLHKDVFS